MIIQPLICDILILTINELCPSLVEVIIEITDTISGVGGHGSPKDPSVWVFAVLGPLLQVKGPKSKT